MDGDRTTRALTRIDAALARIEAAARRPTAAIPTDPGLSERHTKLKDAVTQSLRQLDDLIAGGGT